MDPVSRSYTGAALQVRQKKTLPPASANQNSASVTFRGDSFHRTQKSAAHFAGGRGRETAKDGQESTLYKGYILWHGQYLTKEEYRQEKAKNDAIWDSLMAGGSASTTQPAAEPTATEDWGQDPVDLGAGFHHVSSSKTAASLLATSSHAKKTRDQEDTEYKAAQAGKSPDELWEEWTKSLQQEPQATSLSHSVSVLKPDEAKAPRRSVSPIEEDENEHAGSSTAQVALGYESDTAVGQFKMFGKNFWEKVYKGNRNQPGVYRQVTFDD